MGAGQIEGRQVVFRRRLAEQFGAAVSRLVMGSPCRPLWPSCAGEPRPSRQLLESRPQRRAATSRASASPPRSERTQRASVLVTTQTKVSPGVGFVSGVSRNRTSASSGPSFCLHVLHRQRRRAGQRGVFGEVLGQKPVDLGDARVDGGEPRQRLRLGLGVALVRRLAERRVALFLALSPLGGQILALPRQGGEPRIARGAARGHLRQGLRRLGARRPLRGLEALADQSRLMRAAFRREAPGGFDKASEVTAILLRFAPACFRSAPGRRHRARCAKCV